VVRYDRAANRHNSPAIGLRKNEIRKIVKNLDPCFAPRLAKTAHGIPHSSKRIPAMIQKEANTKVDAECIPTLQPHFPKFGNQALANLPGILAGAIKGGKK
jgi:hypothetical protein